MATTELLTDPGHSREDLRMIRQAIRHDWEIPEQLMAALPKVAGAMALDKKEKPATRLKAMETILKMKAQNEETLPPQQPQAPQTTINVGVSVDNRTDTGRDPLLAIGERIQAARVLRQSGG